jgi:hypothetical protein
MDSNQPQPRGVLLLLLNCVIAVGLPVIGTRLGLREYDVDPRMLRGAAYWSLIGCVFLILPVTLLILGLIREKRITPWARTLIVMSPVFLVNLPTLADAIFSPTSVRKDFQKRMHHPLPANATRLHAWYSHAPGEASYMFCFNTMPEDTEALLESGSFKRRENHEMNEPEFGGYFDLPIGGARIPEGWPHPKSWEGFEVYSSDTIKDYSYILTDKSKTKVFVMVGDT